MSTSDAAAGPFRRGARVVIATHSLGAEEHRRAAREATRGTVPAALTLGGIGVATIALSVSLGGVAYLGVGSGVAIVVLVLVVRRRIRKAGSQLPPARSVELSEHGIALDAGGRRSFWPWRVVRAVHVLPGASWVDVGAQGWLALPRDPRVDEALAPLPRGRFAPGLRKLAWLALAYVALTLALALALPAWLGPPSPWPPARPTSPAAESHQLLPPQLD